MSGGSYDYISIQDLSEVLIDHINNEERLDLFKSIIDSILLYSDSIDVDLDKVYHVAQITENIVQQLDLISKQIVELERYVENSGLRNIWKTVEWIDSGDYTKEAIIPLLNNFEQKIPIPLMGATSWQSLSEIEPKENCKYFIIDQNNSLQIAIFRSDRNSWIEYKSCLTIIPKFVAKINFPEVF